MKKLILSLVFSMVALSAVAKENITIIYSWTAADPAANFYRSLAESSNKMQDKYNFILDTKPGAGGAVAAKFVEANPATNILANSSALFIRPIFFPNESHEVGSFRSIMPMCQAPMLITTSKYKSWDEVPKDKPLSIGMSGMGTTTHLVATQIVERYPNIQIIPFKSTSDALVSAMGGQTDFAVSFTGEIQGYLTPTPQGRRVYVLGTTGTHPVAGAQPLVKQGFPATLANMSSMQQLFVSRKFPEDKYKEVRAIFVKAAATQLVKDANAMDSCVPNNQMPDAEIDNWFNFQLVHWRRIALPIATKLKQ